MATKHHALVALVTGGGKRLGALMTRALHAAGYQVIIHYRHSVAAAETLARTLNATRPHSAVTLAADFNHFAAIQQLAKDSVNAFGKVDLLINNASDYFASAFATTSLEQWQQLHNSNCLGPYFLTQALLPNLKAQHGRVINVTDANLSQSQANYSAYRIAKAGLAMMTQCLAKELTPEVTVQELVPGKTLWPNDEPVIDPEQIADALLCLLKAPNISKVVF